MKQVELLTNYDIIEISKEYHINLLQCTQKANLRVSPRYNLPSCYILNLDDFEGSHWVALFCIKNQAFYFDSYGQPCPEIVNTFCKKHNLKKLDNLTQIQHLKATTCGYFCLYFLWFMTNQLPVHYNETKIKNAFYHFIEPFEEDNQNNNDIILQNLIKTNMVPL